MNRKTESRGGSAPHTAGEWKVTRFGYKGSYAVDGPNGEQIGTLSEWKDAPEEQEANANLMAAAPDMEAALQRICAEAESWHSVHGHSASSVQCDSICQLIPEMQAALRKARGE